MPEASRPATLQASPGWFAHDLRVRYAECDAQHVVFNANYLSYFDQSLTEMWREAVGGYEQMLQRGVDMVVAEASLRFRAPARFDDVVRLEMAFERIGTTSLPSLHRAMRGDELLVEASIRHVMVDRLSWEKTPVPAWLRSALAPWTLG